MNSDLANKVEKVYDMVHQANVYLYKIWLSDMLFKWHWWIEVALTIGIWVLWLKYRKKESTYRLLFAGALSALISVLLNESGIAMGLWGYTSKVLPLLPGIFPWDLCIIPVGVMFAIQIKPKANPWLKSIILAIIGSYIWQPVAQWLYLYNPKGWKHYYSIPFVIFIYMISHFVATRKQFEKI